MKIEKKYFSWLFAVIVLSILLVISIILGVSGWYFSNEKSKVTDFKLGSDVEIFLNKNSANSVSMDFDGAFISGEKLDQIVAIKNLDQASDIYVRAKGFVYSSANEFEPISFVTTDNWVYNANDGYYYFKDAVPAQNKISLCSQIFLDEQYTLISSSNYIITFLVEGISIDHSVQSFWGYNFIE